MDYSEVNVSRARLHVIVNQAKKKSQSRESFAEVATGTLLSFWIYRISYILNLCLIKTSILLFYKFIASSRKSFHHLVRGLLAITLLGSASMIVAAVFQCYPVEDAWSFEVFERGFQGIRPNQCYNPGPFWIANAAYNLVTDIMIWFLPFAFFLNLSSMPMRRRLGLIAIFSVGIVALVASAARLRVLLLWLSGFRAQQDNAANLMIWSQVEQNTGIIAGSIPFLRPLMCKLFGKSTYRQHHSPPVFEEDSPGLPTMPRMLVIPSPTPTVDDRAGFSVPKTTLAPIEMRNHNTWGNAIWDGTQVRQVLT